MVLCLTITSLTVNAVPSPLYICMLIVKETKGSLLVFGGFFLRSISDILLGTQFLHTAESASCTLLGFRA